jgi:tetratricopeptide (TPR) repeat protein
MSGTWLAVLIGLPFFFVQPALGQDADAVRKAVSDAGLQVEQLEERYLRQPLMERDHAVTARISDGQLFHLTRDYERAAMVLLDVVRRPGIEEHPGYREVLYYLGDSLYHLRNFRAAAEWYEVLTQRGNLEQRQLALGRLIEIAVATRNEAAAQSLLDRAEQLMKAAPEAALLYAVGKFHYRQGRLDASRAAFARVPVDDVLWFRAHYHLGVVEVKARRLAEGLAAFAEVVSRGDAAEGLEDDQRVAVDEARLAVGRIHYEQGDLDAAVAAYGAVPRESASFDEALYESVWISVKQGEFEKALRKLEIQLIAQPDVIQGPEARLLQGKLLLMLGRFEEGTRAFQEVLYEFEPLKTEMRTVKAQGDLVAHFNQVIGQGIADFDLTSFLPPRAAEFAGSDAEADRALALVADLGAQRRDLEEMERTIRRLDAALSSPSRIERRPRLREGWMRAAEVRAQMVEARAQLLDQVARGDRSPELAALRRARQSAGLRYAEVPRSTQAQLACHARADDALRRLDQQLFEQDLNIRGLEAQLAAVSRFVDDRARIEGGAAQDASVLARVRAEHQEALQLRARLREVAEQLIVERMQIGVGDAASVRDERVRLDYHAAIEAETEWLRARGAQLPVDVLNQAREVDARARRFQKATENLVSEWVVESSRVLAEERSKLALYQGELAQYQAGAETLGGAIAARSFLHVLGRIEALVLEADVGLIDVAWKQKQDQSDQITRLLDRQAADVKALDQTWREVRGD